MVVVSTWGHGELSSFVMGPELSDPDIIWDRSTGLGTSLG